MDTNDLLRDSLVSQYRATLDMLRQTVTQCPDSLWNDTHLRNAFWRVAYHALFYTHLYLQKTDRDFVPWAKHRPEVEGGASGSERADAKPYTQAEILEYINFCEHEAISKTATADFAAESGFSWYPCSKLEMQLVILRHLQLHAGELSEQLSDKTGTEIHWVGMRHD